MNTVPFLVTVLLLSVTAVNSLDLKNWLLEHKQVKAAAVVAPVQPMLTVQRLVGKEGFLGMLARFFGLGDLLGAPNPATNCTVCMELTTVGVFEHWLNASIPSGSFAPVLNDTCYMPFFSTYNATSWCTNLYSLYATSTFIPAIFNTTFVIAPYQMCHSPPVSLC